MFFFLFALLFACREKKGNAKYKSLVFQKNRAYICYRETDSKAGGIASSYNIHQSRFSHVGLGLIVKDSFKIFHILPEENRMLKQSAEEFYNPRNDSVKSAQILEVENISPKDFAKILDRINDLYSENIKFDRTFSSKDDNYFYCSELVCTILTPAKDLNFKKNRKKIYGLDAAFLKRDFIEYYPVDIFLDRPGFVSLKKW